MSQDIFGDLEGADDPDDPGTPLGGTPVEFSGVSGNEQSPVIPNKQLVPAVPPAAIAPVTPPEIQVWKCLTCNTKKTIYKTLNGYTNHMKQRHGIDAVPAAVTRTIAPTAGSTTVTVPTAGSSSATVSSAGPKQTFTCTQCKRTLATESGYLKHCANHKLQDAAKRKPSYEDLGAAVADIIANIIKEIMIEPIYNETGQSKKEFLVKFQDSTGSREWGEFVLPLTRKIYEFVSTQEKVLPQNQYEDSQQKLQKYLFDIDTMETLKLKLIQVCPEKAISTIVAGKLVFRMATKLLVKVQVWMIKAMRVRSEPPPVLSEKETASVMEKKGFLINLGELFRAFFKKGHLSDNKLLKARSPCLSKTFVDCGQRPIAAEHFLMKENWFSGDENNIVISNNAESFFTIVEQEVQSCLLVVPLVSDLSQEVLEKILQNVDALNYWFYLTNAHFTEEDSLLFMKDLVKQFVRRSLVLRDRQKNAAESNAIRATEASLRTHLKRNPPAKDS